MDWAKLSAIFYKLIWSPCTGALRSDQGDQISLWKNGQTVAQSGHPGSDQNQSSNCKNRIHLFFYVNDPQLVRHLAPRCLATKADFIPRIHGSKQGDQVGGIFAYCAIIYFG
jgi:hypothetical protein